MGGGGWTHGLGGGEGFFRVGVGGGWTQMDWGVLGMEWRGVVKSLAPVMVIFILPGPKRFARESLR